MLFCLCTMVCNDWIGQYFVYTLKVENKCKTSGFRKNHKTIFNLNAYKKKPRITIFEHFKNR